MSELLSQYWLVIVIAALLVVLAVFFSIPRRDPRPPEIDADAARTRLEPRKPDIVAAKRNVFSEKPVTALPPVHAAPPPHPAADAAPTEPTAAPPAAPKPVTPPAKASPAPKAVPTPAKPTPAAIDTSPATRASDDLTLLKGVGPKLVAKLTELGVTRFDQIAGWGEADIDRIDAELGAFAGRIRRDDWIEQARLLAAGDRAEFEAKFGALG